MFSLAIPILWHIIVAKMSVYQRSNFNGLSFWAGLTFTLVNCTNTLVPTIILIRNEYCKVFYACTDERYIVIDSGKLSAN